MAGGGSLYITDGARVGLEPETVFLRNHASGDGGAAFLYSGNDAQPSSLVVNSTAAFQKNFCGGGGGAFAVVAAGAVTFATTKVTFSQNCKNCGGGRSRQRDWSWTSV